MNRNADTKQNRNPYADILYSKRPISARHSRMSLQDRGAQFAPFAALTGYDSVLTEAARSTEPEKYLDEQKKEELNRKLQRISESPEDAGEIMFCCFAPDDFLKGGEYVMICGTVSKIDLYKRSVVMNDGNEFAIDNIVAITLMREETNGEL